jgi:hypothetical protein
MGNIDIGEAGCRRAVALISTALCAESSIATLSEDWAKVDIKFSYRDAFDKSRLITHHCQVKSGSSHKIKSSNKSEIKLNINKETLSSLGDNGSLIAWVPAKPSSRVYWYAIESRKFHSTPLKIQSHQYVRPSLKYDLSRVISSAKWSKRFSRQNIKKIGDDERVMLSAKNEYKKLCDSGILHPLVGNLNITRFAWRHVTRRSKSKSRRLFSLSIVPYLKTFLTEYPDRYIITDPSFREEAGNIIETRYLLCWYRKAMLKDNDTYSLLIRIKEEVCYPKKWYKYPLRADDIKQVATLASWWAKIDK